MTEIKNQLALLLAAAFLVFAFKPSLESLGGLFVTAALFGLWLHGQRQKDDNIEALRKELYAQLGALQDKVNTLVMRGQR